MLPAISIDAISFQIGDFSLDTISLDILSQEYCVLTGTNGSGKTLLLKLIAGLYKPDAGRIVLNSRCLNSVPPWKRNIGYVPQDGMLFPRRTVRENISFGLEVRGISSHTINRKVNYITELLLISHLLDRMPRGLSGGEQQKVCLARALVIDPAVLLLDEPVSAIDEATRDTLCFELREIHSRLNLTTIHISHNSRETAIVADRIIMLSNGRLQSSTANTPLAKTTPEP